MRNKYIKRIGFRFSLGNQKVRLKKGLLDELLSLFSIKNSLDKNHFNVATIDMNEGDGMTRSCIELKERIEKLYRTYTIHFLSNSAKSFHSLPNIAHIVGVNKFMKHAVSNKLATGYLRVFGISKTLLVFLSIAISLIGILLTQVLKDYSKQIDNGLWAMITSKEVFFTIIGISAFLLVAKYFTEKFTFSTESKSIQQFKETLSSPDSRKYEKLVDSLVEDLIKSYAQMAKPRVVIIDNFSRLDYITKRVIKGYIDFYIERGTISQGKEIIISFDIKESIDKLSVDLLFKLKKGGFNNDFATFYDIENVGQNEKEQIISDLGLNKDRVEYNILSNIVHSPQLYKFEEFEEIRSRSETDQACLALIYFISLSSIPTKLLFSKKSVISLLKFEPVKDFISFPRKSSDKKFSEYFISKFKYYFNNDIGRDFNVEVYYFINDRIKVSLESYCLTLELPSEALGHAIWVFIKYKYVKEQCDKQYWLMSLRSHLVKSTPSDLNLVKGKELRNETMFAIIHSIENSIENGQFHNVSELVNTLYDCYALNENVYIENEIVTIDEIHLIAWKAYFTTKDINVLAKILDAYSSNNLIEEHNKTNERETNELVKAYFNYVPTPAYTSDIKEKAVWQLVALLKKKNNFYFKLHVESLTGITTNVIRKSLSEARFQDIKELSLYSLTANQNSQKGYLSDIFHKKLRFDYQSMSSLINSIWLDNYTHYSYAGEIGTTTGWNDRLSRGKEYLDKSYSVIQNYVLISDYVFDAVEQSRKENLFSYVKFAKLGELALVLAASSFITAKNIRTDLTKISLNNIEPDFDEKGMVANLNKIYSNSGKIINLSIPYVSSLEHLSSDSIKEQIKSTFNLYDLVWDKFGFSEFGADLNNKRIQFELFTNPGLQPDTIDMNLVNSLEDVLKIKNYLGLTSNLLISEYLNKISDLTDLYFNNATSLAIESEFEDTIVKQLAYTTLLLHQKTIKDATYLVSIVLDKNNQENSFLFDTIIKNPEKKIFSLLFKLSKNYRTIADEDILREMRSVLEGIPDFMENQEEKRKATNLFKWIDTSNKIKDLSEEEAIKLLRSWSDRKDLFFYAAILIRLFDKGFQSEFFRKEVIEVISEPGDLTFSTYLLLANKYARRFLINNSDIDQDDFNTIISFIRREIPKWESINDVSTNSDIYTTLYKCYPKIYEAKYTLWTKLEIEVFHKKFIVKMLEEGKYFLILKQYVDRAMNWDLPMDILISSYLKYINMSPEESKAYIASKSSSTHIVRPIDQGIINAEFLILGNALLRNISELSVPQKEILGKINVISQKTLPRLVELLLKMPKLPIYFKQIMENYYRHFDFYSRL